MDKYTSGVWDKQVGLYRFFLTHIVSDDKKFKSLFFLIQLHIHIKAEMIKSDGMHIKYQHFSTL